MAPTSILLVFAAAAGAASPGQVRAAPPDPAVLSFENAHIGMSLQAWRKAPFPGQPNSHVTAACAGGARVQPGLTRAGATSGASTMVCDYVSRYGAIALTEDVPWTQGLLVKSPRYVFTDGRLSRIDLHIGIDALDSLMVWLKARYGAPSRLVHDNMKTRVGPLPRLTARWNTEGGAVELVDPSPDLANMTLSFIAAPAGGRAAIAG